MESCDPVGTLMEIKDKLNLDQNGTLVDATKYRSMIGALMYLTSSRPEILHATCLCARYQVKPTEKHLKEVKQIFHYLRGTVNTGLWYTKDSGFKLTGFSDADYAGCKDSFKSTSGGAQFLGEKLVSWSSKKQDCMALSTAEVEYVSLSACCAQILWMRAQLTGYGFNFTKIPIYYDSKSAIAISCNPVQHSRTKHIAVCYHFIKEHVEKGTIELYFVKTDYQLADIFTKALPTNCFNYLVRRLGMRSLSPQELERLAKSRLRFDFPYSASLEHDPGDGEFCQRCTYMRCGSGLSKGLCLICGNNQNSLNDSPSISKNSSQSPPHINHHCCYECGDPLDDIFCKRCTCMSCGKGAHIGYNCPPKVSVISNPEPCKNQTIDELPQTFPSIHPTCYSGDESPFTYDSTPNIVNDSPNVFNPPPQPLKYSYEFCGNDAYYGHDCPPQVPFTYDPEPCYNQDFNFP
nr:copia protein [Tanacetum cinerariifolium]